MTGSDQRARDMMVALADIFGALVEAPVGEFDVIELLDRLSGRCVELFDVTAAGLLLADHRGALDLAAASTEQVRLLGLFQLRNGEGPCLDCYHSGQLVRCSDLAATPARWPRFASAAVEAGFAAVHALPMRWRDEVVGGLGLYTASPGTLDEDTAGLAQALADVATIGILRNRALCRHGRVVEQLQATLDSRVLVEQAKGVLAERSQITVAEAYALLRGHARATNQRVVDIVGWPGRGTSTGPQSVRS